MSQKIIFYDFCLVPKDNLPSRKRRKERPVGPWKSGFGVWKRPVGLFWGFRFEEIFFNEINRRNFFQWNQQCKFFSMNSASMNSALETFFEIFVMKSALKKFSNFSKKINVQTIDRSVKNFWGLGFGMLAILPIPARKTHASNFFGKKTLTDCRFQ